VKTRVITAAALALFCLQAAAEQTTPLKALLAEADKNNLAILAARKQWHAATYVHAQVDALPDPHITFQAFSVGSPRLGAGLSNSNFAYVGIGASQDIPYPGKLRLKGTVADAAADAKLAQVDVVRSRVKEQVKLSYLRLAYLQHILRLLATNRSTLAELIDAQIGRYRAGQGDQSDILKAQLDRTRLLREITMDHEEMAQLQADLKNVLNRPPDSPDVIAGELVESPAARPLAALVLDTRRNNPNLLADERAIDTRKSTVNSTKLAGKPDFSLGYMYQRTGLDFPAYYMATFTIVLPRKKRVAAEKAEASEQLEAARLMRAADARGHIAEVRKQYAALESTNEELKQYRDGILPQAQAAYNSAVAALKSNKQSLEAVLVSLDGVLQLKREYAQALLDHETAIVRLQTLTGEALR
jgi:outer membrane protein TolC